MPTVSAVTPKRDLPRPLADHFRVAPDAETQATVGTFPEPVETEAERKTAVSGLKRAMDALSVKAKKNGLTEEKLKQILVEIEAEEDDAQRKTGQPTRNPNSPIDINHW